MDGVSGASGGARTPDPCLRRALLYPAELLTQGDLIGMLHANYAHKF